MILLESINYYIRTALPSLVPIIPLVCFSNYSIGLRSLNSINNRKIICKVKVLSFINWLLSMIVLFYGEIILPVSMSDFTSSEIIRFLTLFIITISITIILSVVLNKLYSKYTDNNKIIKYKRSV